MLIKQAIKTVMEWGGGIPYYGSGTEEEFIKDHDYGKNGKEWKEQTAALDTKPFDPQKLKQKDQKQYGKG